MRFNRGKHIGEIYGFPMVRGAWCNDRLKARALDAIAKGDIREDVLSCPKQKGQHETGNNTGIPMYPWSKVVPETQNQLFSRSSLAQGANINIVQYLGIASDEPERIRRHTRSGVILPLVEIGWDEAYCRKWCEENDLLSPIYTSATRGGCWFCHNQGVDQLRLLRKNYPDLWKLLLKWDSDSPVSFKPDGHTVHDFEKRFDAEDKGDIIPGDRKFRWRSVLNDEKEQSQVSASIIS